MYIDPQGISTPVFHASARRGLVTRRTSFWKRYWSGQMEWTDDHVWNEERQRLLASALNRLPVESLKVGKVLEAGCGGGSFTAHLKHLGFKVVGIDIAIEAIRVARTNARDLFSCCSLEDYLPFHDGSFTCIWSSEVLEHLFDIHFCLSEFNRVLSPSGILILTTPYHGILKNVLIAILGFERHFNPYISHIRFFTKRSLTEVLFRAGFKPILWHGIGRMWPLYKSFFLVAIKISSPGHAPENIE